MTVNTFRVNGTLLTLQPSEHNWLPREAYGTDGGGHDVLPAVRKYELKWDLMPAEDFNQLVNLYNSVSVTGTVVVDLPKWNDATYTFFSYTGCVLQEPQLQGFFEEHQVSCSLLITNIRT